MFNRVIFQASQPDIVRALLATGADPGVHNAEGKTPLDLTTSDRVKNVFNEQLLQWVATSKYVLPVGLLFYRLYYFPENCVKCKIRLPLV